MDEPISASIPKDRPKMLETKPPKSYAFHEIADWPTDKLDADTQFILLDDLAPLMDELKQLKYVPGHFKCSKCGLYLTKQNLYMKSGTTGPNSEPAKCENGCGPMWKVTWQDHADAAVYMANNLAIERNDNKTALKAILNDLMWAQTQDRGTNLYNCLKKASDRLKELVESFDKPVKDHMGEIKAEANVWVEDTVKKT